MNSGNRNKKFNCTICNKSFYKSSLLKRHEIGHSNLKPFECNDCNQKFTQKSSLNRHQSNVHLKLKQYKCPHCNTSCSQQSNLLKHIERLHKNSEKNSIEKYPCTYCSCVFKKLNSFNRHQGKFHKDDCANNINDDLDLTTENIIKELQNLQKFQGETSYDNSPKVVTESEKVVEIPKVVTEIPNEIVEKVSPRSEEWVIIVDNLDNDKKIRTVRQIIEHEKKLLECNICTRKFRRSHDLLRHFRSHTMEKKFQCNVCKKTFGLKCTLKFHMKVHTAPKNSKIYKRRNIAKKSNSINNSNSQTEKIMKSMIPPIKITNELIYEKATDLKKLIFLCSYCGTQFKTKIHLKYHENRHLDKQIKCEICEKYFCSRSSLKEHHKIHLNQRLYKCLRCKNVSFLNQSALNRHETYHSEDRKYLCAYCSKKFKTFQNCKDHIRRHVKDIVNEQENKEVVLSNTNDLMVPILEKLVISPLSNSINRPIDNVSENKIGTIELHPKPKIFQCEICTKIFKKPIDLRRHVLIHTKEKNYSCDICMKNFTLKYTLKAHMKIHSENRLRVNCQICGKKYANKSVLKVHIRMHFNEMPYSCNFENCIKKFRTIGHQKQHLKQHQKQ